MISESGFSGCGDKFDISVMIARIALISFCRAMGFFAYFSHGGRRYGAGLFQDAMPPLPLLRNFSIRNISANGASAGTPAPSILYPWPRDFS